MELYVYLVRFLASLLVTICAVYIYSWHQYRKYKFPPSPPGRLPLIGHSHLLPKFLPGDKTKEWADQLGSEMMYVRLGGTDWIFLNSSRVVEDLLEKRSALYSGRPVFAMVGELMSKGKRLVLQGYTPMWRELRRVHHQLLIGKPAESYKPRQDLEAKQAMWEILHNPEEWYLHTIRFSASCISCDSLTPVTVGMVYGERQRGQSALFNRVSDAQDEFLRNNVPGMWLVDGYPQLRHIPKALQWWRGYGDKVYNETVDAFRGYYRLMLEKQSKGTQKDCFATKFYAEADTKYPQFDFDQRLFTCGGIIEAGSDTTKNQLNMLVAAWGAEPGDWIAMARKELDQVCGNAQRLPTFDDWDRLPFIQAIMKECLRWRPNVNQTGFPHALTQDDEYEGYVFPAGTVVTINNWAISLNPKEYKDPHRFKPERFLNADLYNPLKGHFGYGAGNLAIITVIQVDVFAPDTKSRITRCLSSLAAFYIALMSKRIRYIPSHPLIHQDHPIDTYHIPITPLPGQAYKAPFQVKMKVRSPAHRELILRDCDVEADDVQ